MRIMNELPSKKKRGISCGGYGCMDLETRPGTVATKFFKQSRGAIEENENNKLIAKVIDKRLLSKYTLFIDKSIKSSKTLCENIKGRSDSELMNRLAQASRYESFSPDSKQICTLEYLMGNGDLDNMVEDLVRTCKDNGFGLDGACASFTKVLIKQILQINDKFLAKMHDKGLFHMDIKKENLVLLMSENSVSVRVIDFGLMEVLQDEYDKFPTQGTRMLMSPVSLLWSDRHHPQTFDEVLRNRWRTRVVNAILILFGDMNLSTNKEVGNTYFAMIASVMELVPSCLKNKSKMKYLLKKCDDYSIFITCIELWPNIKTLFEEMPELESKFKDLITYDIEFLKS